jgi:glycosyltransferase involved in cell wall biosynthesis
MMKLLVTAPWGERAGGAEMMLWLFLRHFDRSRIEPVVVFLQPGPLEREVAGLDIATVVVPSGRLREPVRATRVVGTVRSLIRRERPDLVLNWSAKTQLYGAAAATAAGMGDRVVWWQHGIPNGHWLDRVATALPARAVGCSSRQSSLAQRVLRPRRPTFVVYPGIELLEIDSQTRTAVRHELRLPEDALIVGAVGRLEPSKKQDILLEVIARLIRAGHPVHGLIVGGEALGLSAGYEALLRRKARALGLSESVTFTGQVTEGARCVASMDVFVNPSTSESFGIGLLEAMRAGVAPVAFARGGPREIIEPGQSGLLVGEDTEEALSAAIEALVVDPELRMRLGTAARQRFESRFTAERMSHQLAQRLEALCP